MKFFNEKGNIRVELLDDEAKKTAEMWIDYQKDREGRILRDNRGKVRINSEKTLSSAQLRRFFNDFRQLEKKVEKQDFEKVKPLIKMVKSKASYAANPSKPKIPSQFKDFLIDNVNSIDNKKDFEAFMLHFEAIVGFYYGLEGVSIN